MDVNKWDMIFYYKPSCNEKCSCYKYNKNKHYSIPIFIFWQMCEVAKLHGSQ